MHSPLGSCSDKHVSCCKLVLVIMGLFSGDAHIGEYTQQIAREGSDGGPTKGGNQNTARENRADAGNQERRSGCHQATYNASSDRALGFTNRDFRHWNRYIFSVFSAFRLLLRCISYFVMGRCCLLRLGLLRCRGLATWTIPWDEKAGIWRWPLRKREWRFPELYRHQLGQALK